MLLKTRYFGKFALQQKTWVINAGCVTCNTVTGKRLIIYLSYLIILIFWKTLVFKINAFWITVQRSSMQGCSCVCATQQSTHYVFIIIIISCTYFILLCLFYKYFILFIMDGLMAERNCPSVTNRVFCIWICLVHNLCFGNLDKNWNWWLTSVLLFTALGICWFIIVGLKRMYWIKTRLNYL